MATQFLSWSRWWAQHCCLSWLPSDASLWSLSGALTLWHLKQAWFQMFARLKVFAESRPCDMAARCLWFFIDAMPCSFFVMVAGRSMSGKLVYPFADVFVVHWPELAEKCPCTLFHVPQARMTLPQNLPHYLCARTQLTRQSRLKYETGKLG